MNISSSQLKNKLSPKGSITVIPKKAKNTQKQLKRSIFTSKDKLESIDKKITERPSEKIKKRAKNGYNNSDLEKIQCKHGPSKPDRKSKGFKLDFTKLDHLTDTQKAIFKAN